MPASSTRERIESALATSYTIVRELGGGGMPTYSILEGVTLNNVPIEQVGAAFNHQLITTLLRNRYGFQGIVLTDWAVTNDCAEACRNGAPQGERPSFASVATPWGVENLSKVDRFAKAVNAGVDQFGGTEEANYVVDAVNAGKIDRKRVHASDCAANASFSSMTSI